MLWLYASMAMTLINCDIRDSQGQPLTGFIRVTLDYDIKDNGRNYLVVPRSTPLVSGTCVLNLVASEVAKVTYLFEIVQTTLSGSVTIETIVKQFHAKVPERATAIALTDLAYQTGITREAFDASISTLARRLYNDASFWDALRTNLLTPQATWNSALQYRRGNVVSYDGGSYLYTYPTASTGVLPTDTAYWFQMAARGATGTGTTGNDTAYNATSWNGQTDAPSRNALRDIIETLASQSQLTGLLTGATLTNPILGSAIPALNDNSSKIVSTQWVQAVADVIKRGLVPVGTLAHWATASAPALWVLCDGRALSRSTYNNLYSLWGTTYGAGNGTSTFNVPDLRGRSLIGMDNMGGTNANRVAATWARTIGGSGGAMEHTLAETEMPAHAHSLLAHTGGGFIGYRGDNGGTAAIPTAGTYAFPVTATDVSGQSLPHNNMQPSIAMSVIVYAGV